MSKPPPLSQSNSSGVRTCADIAAIGVHPSVVEALQQYKKALMVYDTTVSKGPASPVASQRSNQRPIASFDHHNATASAASPKASPAPSPAGLHISTDNNEPKSPTAASAEPTGPNPHANVASVRNRLLLDITADYVCENAFRQLFVDHRKYAISMEKDDSEGIPAEEKGNGDLSGGSPSASPLHPPPSGCKPFVKGPRLIPSRRAGGGPPTREFVTISTENPGSDLSVDDMLWVVDNRKATPAFTRALSAWQDNFRSDGNSTAAPVSAPPTQPTATASSPHRHQQAASPSPSQPHPSGSNKASAAAASPPPINPISSSHPLAPSAIGVAAAQQIQLHRRNVVLTREYFSNAAAAESDYRVAVQDLIIPPPQQQQQHTLERSDSLTAPASGFTPIGSDHYLSPIRAASPAGSHHHPQNNHENNNNNTSNNSGGSTLGDGKDKEKDGGGFGKFMKAFSKAISSDKDKDKEKEVRSPQPASPFSPERGERERGEKESVTDVLAASASSLAATIGRITGGKIGSGGGGPSHSDDPFANRSGGVLISELVGLPPIAWRETLALNIITQWTYTLTIAVVKLVTAKVPAPTTGGGGESSASSPLTSTASPPPQQQQSTMVVNKELVVVRHISKRVYAQPTKAMFHSKEHRGESGDTMDYPNVYFNIDDFEDESLFRDIKLCEGYTFAVLLTAGASRNSNATIFRGALSYEVVMERIKRNAERSGGKSIPIAPAHPSLGGGGNSNASFGGAKSGASFVLGTEYILKGSGEKGGGGKGGVDDYGKGGGGLLADSYTPKMFIPLVGPERKGKAELAVSISETEIMLSQMNSQNNSFQGHTDVSSSSASSSRASAGTGASNTAFRDEGHIARPSASSLADKEKEKDGAGGIFGRLINKVKTKVDGMDGSSAAGSGEAASSSAAGFQQQQPVLQGNEAIQCCLTFVSVHAQHVMDVLMSATHERPRQWLSYYDTPEDLTRALASGASR